MPEGSLRMAFALSHAASPAAADLLLRQGRSV